MKCLKLTFCILGVLFSINSALASTNSINCEIQNPPAIDGLIPKKTVIFYLELSLLTATSVNLKKWTVGNNAEVKSSKWIPRSVAIISGEYKIYGDDFVAYLNPKTKVLAIDVGYNFVELTCDDVPAIPGEEPSTEYPNKVIIEPKLPIEAIDEKLTLPPDWEDLLDPYPHPNPLPEPYPQPTPGPAPFPEPIGPLPGPGPMPPSLPNLPIFK